MGRSNKCYSSSLKMEIYALLDCNNFFVSCEKIFAPSLDGKPVIVLSGNDGCVVSRSNEAKALGIKMGEPYFQIKTLCKLHKVKVFSGNHSFYSDISERVMDSLRYLGLDIEIYSIDEAFFSLTHIPISELNNFVEDLAYKISSWTSIPVSIGIGNTKTLAKTANYLAKNNRNNSSFFNLLELDEIKKRKIYSQIDIEEVWGIGKKTASYFRSLGIINMLDIYDLDLAYMRKHCSVVSLRTIYEIKEIPCLNLREKQNKKSILCSESFAYKHISLSDLQEAISDYIARAARKLRNQKSKAGSISVFIRTSKHAASFYGNSIVYDLPTSTSDTRVLMSLAKKLLQEIYIPGYHYHKAGILLSNLSLADEEQLSLFVNSDNKKQELLMQKIDSLNKSGNTIFFAAQGLKQEWRYRGKSKSPQYTRNWYELPLVS